MTLRQINLRARLARCALAALSACVAPSFGLLATDLAPRGAIIISEIQYNPPGSLGDDALFEYVELYNRAEQPVDISGWRVEEGGADDESFVFPAGTLVPAAGYLVIARDAAALKSAYEEDFLVVGDATFALGNEGDTVRLFDATGHLVDRVEYSDRDPWPLDADGNFSSLERISLEDDISDFTNFAASAQDLIPGTPGAPNSRAGEIPARHGVVINEILYNPVVDPLAEELRHCPEEEFVELHNRSDATIDLSGWQLVGGVNFSFPEGTSIEPAGYLVLFHEEEGFRAKYGDVPDAVGPYARELDDGGEDILLLDAEGFPADHVDYDDTAPWPVNPDGLKGSLELIDPFSDNDRGRAWQESADFRGTPGAANSATIAFDAAGGNAPPQITAVAIAPEDDPLRRELRSTDRVGVEARVLDPHGIAAVAVDYQLVAPGDYIRQADARFETDWTRVEMTLDPARGLYRATLPVQPHRTLVRYRIVASDAAVAPLVSREARFPRPGDPEPNLAYFVYDGVPDYVASERSSFGPAGVVHTGLARVPVYQIIGDAADIADLMNRRLAPGDDEYHWRVTFVHADGVHDHCGIRLRGEADSRWSYPRRSLKIRFNKGNWFRGRSNDGTPFPQQRSKTNLMMEHVHRGDGGIHEMLGWKLYRDADVLAAAANFVHVRIVKSPNEHGQFDGDFHGLFLETQQIDASALQEQDRPVAAPASLYKMEGTPQKRVPDCDPSTADVDRFMEQSATDGTREYFEATLDIDRYLSFRTVTELTDNNDMDGNKNYYYYYNSETARWEVAPWDLDHILGGDASGVEPLAFRVPRHFPLEFANRFRFLWQLLYEPRRLHASLDAWSALLEPLANADRDRWLVESTPPFATRVTELKEWLRARSGLVRRFYVDEAVPVTPRVVFPYPGVSPPSPVLLRSSPFADPDGDEHAASRWLVIGEGGDWLHPLWDEESTEGLESIRVPSEITAAGGEFEFRVAHRDTTGRWSFLSEPAAFQLGAPDSTPPTVPGRPDVTFASFHSVSLRWDAARDDQSGVLGYRIMRDSETLPGIPSPRSEATDYAAVSGARHEYRIVAVDRAGLESAPSEALAVDVPAGGRGGWSAPPGGWDYFYDALPGDDLWMNPRVEPVTGYLDGGWSASTLNQWDGSRPGDGTGSPGGVAVDVIADSGEGEGPTTALTLEDPGDPPTDTPPANNSALLFVRDLGDSDPLVDGVTLVARLRVHPAPRDLTSPRGQTPELRGDRGQVGIGHRGDGRRGHFSFWLDDRGLGAVGGHTVPMSAAERTTFHTVWVTLHPEGENARARLYLDGATTPAIDGPFALSRSGLETGMRGTYLELGLSDRESSGAIQVDYFGYKAGAHPPVTAGAGESAFVRGDANRDDIVDTSDAMRVIEYLFLAGPDIDCLDAADADDSGRIDISDAIRLFHHAVGAGPPPRAPFPACGDDPGADALRACGGVVCVE